MAVSVGVGDRIVWAQRFGYEDVEQRVPVWPAITRFRIGSVSKTLTSVAVGQLYEQGRLDLDAPVQRYVPSFPEKRKGTVTTRLLAGHLAGIRHYRDREPVTYTNWGSGEPNNFNDQDAAVMNWCEEGANVNPTCLGDRWKDLQVTGLARGVVEK